MSEKPRVFVLSLVAIDKLKAGPAQIFNGREIYLHEVKEGEDSICKGYYVSDDEEPTQELNKAFMFTDAAEAFEALNEANETWNLEQGEQFVLQDISEVLTA